MKTPPATTYRVHITIEEGNDAEGYDETGSHAILCETHAEAKRTFESACKSGDEAFFAEDEDAQETVIWNTSPAVP